MKELGGVDILINNAGGVLYPEDPPWQKLTPSDWVDAYQLNTVSAFRLSHALVPGMSERGWGRVVNISSTAGSQNKGFYLDYGAAKAALNNFTVNLSKQVGEFGVTVNGIVTGTILTPASEKYLRHLQSTLGWPDDLADTERRYTTDHIPQPIKRLGRPRDIAAAVTFLASDLAGFITGAFLRVEGGTARYTGA